MMDYVKIHVKALEDYKRLSDIEFGRAIRAVLRFMEDGTEADLSGKDSIMYDTLCRQVKEDRESYEQKVQTLRANGSKGGRPKKANGNQKNQMVFEKTKCKQMPPYINNINNNISAGGGYIEPAAAADIAQEHQQVLDAAERAGFPTNAATYDHIIAAVADYGSEWVLAAIARCVEQGASKVSYMNAVLRGFRSDGGPGMPRKPATDPAPVFDTLWG